MMNPLVSIIIPCYNAAAFVAETILSVKNQSYTCWELILVNDGSTDSTSSILKDMVQPGIIIVDQPNSGVSVARNNGARIAKGEYIMFLDADDVLSKDFLQSRVNFFMQHPEMNMIGSIVKVFEKSIDNIVRTEVSVTDDIQRSVLLYQAGSTTTPSSYIFRREVFNESEQIFNPHLSSTADRYFLLEFASKLNGGVITDPESCLYYRISVNSMSSGFTKRLVDDNELFYTELLNNCILQESDKAFLRKGYYILYRSNLRIIRPFRAARYFWRLLFS